MNCANGHPVSPGTNFCTTCGAPLGNSSVSPAPKPSTQATCDCGTPFQIHSPSDPQCSKTQSTYGFNMPNYSDISLEQMSEVGQANQKTSSKGAAIGIGVTLGAILLVFLGFGLSGNSNSSDSSTSANDSSSSATDFLTPSAEPTPTPLVDWYPAGFHVWPSDHNVAFKWADGSCDYYSCVYAKFITQYGCSSFYAAVNFLDSSDAVIDYSNGTLPSLAPMQIAKLRFDDIEGNSSSTQMSEIRCY